MVWLGLLFLLVVRTRVLIGMWPTPSHPDPKSLPFEFHYSLLWIGLFLIAVTGLIGGVCQITGRLFFKTNFSGWLTSVFVSGVIVIGVLIFFPDNRYNWVAWFLD